MAGPAIDPGALLARTYPLPDGGRVRLRLLRRSDGSALRVLFANAWALADELELQRLLRFDPRRRLAIAAVSPRGLGHSRRRWRGPQGSPCLARLHPCVRPQERRAMA